MTSNPDLQVHRTDESTAGCRFVFLADPQVGCMATFSGVDEAQVERFARRGMCVRTFPDTDDLGWDLARLDQAAGAVRREQPDFVVVGGDMVDRIDRPDQLAGYRALVDGIAGIPIHHVPGNHDVAEDATVPTDEALAWYEATFGPPHHAFEHPLGPGADGPVASFIAINSTVLDQPRKVPGADDAELAFLEDRLRTAAGRGPVVVFSHHPPYLRDPDEPDQYWNMPRATRGPLLDLLVEHRVDLVLCGHRHRNDRVVHRGVEIVTSASSGFPLGLDPPGYRVVEVTGDGVGHAYYGFPEPGWDGIGGPPEDRGC